MPISRNDKLGFRKSHAFVIGINEYPDIDANLRTAVPDSIEIAKRLKVLQSFDHVLLRTDIGGEQMQKLLNWIQDKNRSASLSEVYHYLENEAKLPALTPEIAKKLGVNYSIDKVHQSAYP